MKLSFIRNKGFFFWWKRVVSGIQVLFFGGAEFDQEYKFQFWWNRVLSEMQVLFLMEPIFLRKKSYMFDKTEFDQECKFDETEFYQEEKFYFWWTRVLSGMYVLFLTKPSFIRNASFIFDETEFYQEDKFVFDETEFYQECKFIFDKTEFYQKERFYVWWNRVLSGMQVLLLMKLPYRG